MSWKLISALLFTGVLIVSCSSPSEYSLSTFNKSNPDFSFLQTALKGKQVVALGESSHGFGDVQTLKIDMIKYLHKEMGYDVLMFESGYGDVNCSWEFIEQSEAKNLMRGSVFGNFKSQEMFPLFDYLKKESTSEKRLDFAGYDPQLSSEGFEYKLMFIIDRLEPRVIQDSIENGFSSYYTMFQLRDNQEKWQFHKDRLYASIDLAKTILEDNIIDIKEKEVGTDRELKILHNTLDGLKASVDYPFGEALTTGFGLRDSVMAHFVTSQITEDFPNRKIIIWGHNGHIEKDSGEGDNIKWMGHYLEEAFSSKYYSMGIFAKKGQVYTHWNKKNEDFNLSDSTFLEYKITNKQSTDVFVDLPEFTENNVWYNKQIKGYEPESGGLVTFTPTKRFDGIIVLQETGPPTFPKAKNQGSIGKKN